MPVLYLETLFADCRCIHIMLFFVFENAPAIHCAVSECHIDMAKLLLDRGADMTSTCNVYNISWRTMVIAIHICSYTDIVLVGKVGIARGCSPWRR